MSPTRLFITATLVASSVGLAQAQGRSGRDRDLPRSNGIQPNVEQRVEARTDQAIQHSQQRRAGDEAHRSVERHASSAEMAAQAAARRSARDSSKDAELRRFAHARGIRPELVAEKALEHADVHAAIAAGRLSGKPLQLNETQRAQLKEVFGDADLLEHRDGDHQNQSDRRSGRETASTDREKNAAAALPGARANANARLANAIRVRRAQISELRDKSIETGDAKLLERADRLEKTLDIFLENQARVDANLAEVAFRTRGDESGTSTSGPSVSGPVVRTAELDSDSGLIGSE